MVENIASLSFVMAVLFLTFWLAERRRNKRNQIERIKEAAASIPEPPHYDTFVVDEATYDSLMTGERYMGGVVVNGFYCERTGNYIIITYHGE